MNKLSSAPHFNALPHEMLVEIESHLKMHPLEKRVNEYVSRYGLATHVRNTLIDEINKEIRNYQNGLQTKRELDDAIDVIIGDRGMGGKRRTKRTKRNKRTKHNKRR